MPESLHSFPSAKNSSATSSSAKAQAWVLNDNKFNDISDRWVHYRGFFRFEEDLAPSCWEEIWVKFHRELLSEGYDVPQNREDFKPLYLTKSDSRYDDLVQKLRDENHVVFSIDDSIEVIEAGEYGLKKNLSNAKREHYYRQRAAAVGEAARKEELRRLKHGGAADVAAATYPAPHSSVTPEAAQEEAVSRPPSEVAITMDWTEEAALLQFEELLSVSEESKALIQGSLGQEAPREQSDLRNEIKVLPSVQACADFYDASILYQDCIRILRQEQNSFINANKYAMPVLQAREEWATRWAQALSRDEAKAWLLNHCRKTALDLLYKVCDLCYSKSTDIFHWELLESTFKSRRVDEILIHCLVMDRANSLHNMTIRTTGEQGLGWYSKYDEVQYQETFRVPVNPRGATINKRLCWLAASPAYKDDVTIQRWMQMAVPARLQNTRA